MASYDEIGSNGGYTSSLTEAWDETTPTDASYGNTIDNEMIAVRRDSRERLQCQHWFGEEDESTVTWQWEGAHRAGMVNCIKGHDDCSDLQTWADTNYGSGAASWAKFYGCAHHVVNDSTATKCGLYRVMGTGKIRQIMYRVAPGDENVVESAG